MNSTRSTDFEAGVYDPSQRRAETSSYWQWTTGPAGKEWTLAAERVNTGWPASGGLFDLESKWYGFIAAGEGKCWIYRLYAAGRDSFGRQGRYFFVLVRLDEGNLLSPEVAGLFRYFDSERGLPLRTQPLDLGWPEAAPDDVLKALEREVSNGRVDGHWGIDDQLRVTVFPEPLRTDWKVPKPSPFSKGRRGSGFRYSPEEIRPGQVARDVRDFWKRYGLVYVIVVSTLVTLALFGWRWWQIKASPKPPRPVPPRTEGQPVPHGPSRQVQTLNSPATATTAPPGVPATSIENDEALPEDGSLIPENPNQEEDVP
jgi:hypothetical protein